jgi:hypothetical protein
MVSLGRPGAGKQLLASHGFADIERLDVPFAWEFADPELTRVLWPLPSRLMKPYRTSARLSSTAPPSSRHGGGYGMACLCVPKSTSWVTWPANPKEQNAHDG